MLPSTMNALQIFMILAILLSTEGKGCSQKKLDLFVVLDGSKQISSKQFSKVRRCLQTFVSRLDVGLGRTHVGFLLANKKERTKMEIGLGQYTSKESLHYAMGQIEQHRRRKSDIGYALSYVHNKVFTKKDGDRRKVNNVLILLTPRIRPMQLENVLKNAATLKRNKVEIITVYIGKDKMTWNVQDELRAIASLPENVLTLRSTKRFRKTLKRRICPSVRALHPSKGCTRQNHDVFFVLDGSGSINSIFFEKIKHFLIEVVKKLDVTPHGTHVGLLQFSHKLKTKTEFTLGEHTAFEDIKNHIVKMPYQQGGTDTGHALEIVNTEIFSERVSYRPNISDVVVILTDGQASDRNKAILEAKKLRKKGVKIITLGIGEKETIEWFRKDLALMASRPSDVFTVDFTKLTYLVNVLTSEICYAKKHIAQKCAHKQRDILLLVDGSASVGYVNMRKVKTFLKRLVSKLHVSIHTNRVSLIQFSSFEKTKKEFSFDRSENVKQAHEGIRNMTFHAGQRTMLGNALEMANNEIFSGLHGDREQVSDIIILMADGGAHDAAIALENASKLKRRGVQIITVYIPNETDLKNKKQKLQNTEFLKRIASRSEDFYTSKFNNLKYIAADLVKVVCTSS